MENQHTEIHAMFSVFTYISFIVKGLHALNRVYNCVRSCYQPLQKHRALAELSDVKTATEATDAGNVVNINVKNSNESLSVVQEEIPLQDSNQSL
jgi:hypothetical protein